MQQAELDGTAIPHARRICRRAPSAKRVQRDPLTFSHDPPRRKQVERNHRAPKGHCAEGGGWYRMSFGTFATMTGPCPSGSRLGVKRRCDHLEGFPGQSTVRLEQTNLHTRMFPLSEISESFGLDVSSHTVGDLIG